MNANVLHVPAFEDNYIWLIVGGPQIQGKQPCIIVDPGDADPVAEALEHHNLQPVAIFCTHHHPDHVGGVRELAADHNINVYGPAAETIDGVTHALRGGEEIRLAGFPEYRVMNTPGHTAGHIAYFGGNALFCGDTLYSSGCGRIFDGTAEELFTSLKTISQLPPTTRIYCAHEYTLSNLRFALTVEPGNVDTQQYLEHCQVNRQKGIPTVPTELDRELKINPFLRTQVAAIQQAVEQYADRALATEQAVFVELRKWKDEFRG